MAGKGYSGGRGIATDVSSAHCATEGLRAGKIQGEHRRVFAGREDVEKTFPLSF